MTNPDVAMSNNDIFFITWEKCSDKTNTEVHLKGYYATDNGLNIDYIKWKNDFGPLKVNDDNIKSRVPSIDIDKWGRFGVIAWSHEQDSANPNVYDVYLKTFRIKNKIDINDGKLLRVIIKEFKKGKQTNPQNILEDDDQISPSVSIARYDTSNNNPNNYCIEDSFNSPEFVPYTIAWSDNAGAGYLHGDTNVNYEINARRYVEKGKCLTPKLVVSKKVKNIVEGISVPELKMELVDNDGTGKLLISEDGIHEFSRRVLKNSQITISILESPLGQICLIDDNGDPVDSVTRTVGNDDIVVEVQCEEEGPGNIPDLGQHHTCAIADGSAFCWGENYKGQLGILNFQIKTSPTPVAFDSNTGVQ
ncbi:MAG: hypothetical protein ACXAC7_21765, partial [Candidatus Hodarchaeales archaeon]